ncbi:Dynein heavy chain 11, axonemal [Manis javanica]|nr:Dynein heavy chain 11, axonemal [Manis javanica]
MDFGKTDSKHMDDCSTEYFYKHAVGGLTLGYHQEIMKMCTIDGHVKDVAAELGAEKEICCRAITLMHF